MAIPPDPVTPGLLDLLTVAAIGLSAEPPLDDGDDSAAFRPLASSPTTPPFATATASGSRRLWVEVEA